MSLILQLTYPPRHLSLIHLSPSSPILPIIHLRIISPGPQIAREGTMEDMYRLGLVFLELILASFTDDNIGARAARVRLGRLRSNLTIL